MIHIYIQEGVVENVVSDLPSEVGRTVQIHDRDSHARELLLHNEWTIEGCDFTPEYHAGCTFYLPYAGDPGFWLVFELQECAECKAAIQGANTTKVSGHKKAIQTVESGACRWLGLLPPEEGMLSAEEDGGTGEVLCPTCWEKTMTDVIQLIPYKDREGVIDRE